MPMPPHTHRHTRGVVEWCENGVNHMLQPPMGNVLSEKTLFAIIKKVKEKNKQFVLEDCCSSFSRQSLGYIYYSY